MSQKTDTALGILAQQVADETAPGANTAERVGDILQDIIDSKANNTRLDYKEYTALLTWNGSTFTVKQLVNTVGDGTGVGAGDIVWTNPSNGKLYGTMTGAFPTDKLFYKNNTFGAGSSAYFVTGKPFGTGIVEVNLTLHDGTQASTPNFTDLPVSLFVYN